MKASLRSLDGFRPFSCSAQSSYRLGAQPLAIYILLREENVDLDLILRLSRPESILFDAQFIIPGYFYPGILVYNGR